MRYAEGQLSGVQVYFAGKDVEQTINLTGHVPLTAEEYAGNESVSALIEVVKQKVNEKLTGSAAE